MNGEIRNRLQPSQVGLRPLRLVRIIARLNQSGEVSDAVDSVAVTREEEVAQLLEV